MHQNQKEICISNWIFGQYTQRKLHVNIAKFKCNGQKMWSDSWSCE